MASSKPLRPYKILDHPADIRLRIQGRTPQSLFRHAALGLSDLLTGGSLVSLKARRRFQRCIRLSAENREDLLLKWLRELLFLFSAKKIIWTKISFKILSAQRIHAVISGLTFDPSSDIQRYEVKAVTYHGFRMGKRGNKWIADVLFDV